MNHQIMQFSGFIFLPLSQDFSWDLLSFSPVSPVTPGLPSQQMTLQLKQEPHKTLTN